MATEHRIPPLSGLAYSRGLITYSDRCCAALVCKYLSLRNSFNRNRTVLRAERAAGRVQPDPTLVT